MQVCRALIVMISNAPELHGYAVRTLYRNLHAYQASVPPACMPIRQSSYRLLAVLCTA